MTTLNLDQLAAQRAQAMVAAASADQVDTLERLTTKALGVLQEQGVYALMLFLFSRTSDEEKVAPKMRKELYAALKALPAFAQNQTLAGFSQTTPPPDALEFYANTVLNELDQLLLVRDLYEQTLIYTRYGAKAAPGD